MKTSRNVLTSMIGLGVAGWMMLGNPASIWASPGDSEVLSVDSIHIGGADAKTRFEKSSSDVFGILKFYRPGSVAYSDYHVIESGPLGIPRMSFLADIVVLGIHVKGWVIADVSHVPIVCQAPSMSVGYRYTMDLQASDRMLSEQMNAYVVDLCVQTLDDGALKIDATALMTEGPRYRMPYGPVSQGVFRKQLKPVLDALSGLLEASLRRI